MTAAISTVEGALGLPSPQELAVGEEGEGEGGREGEGERAEERQDVETLVKLAESRGRVKMKKLASFNPLQRWLNVRSIHKPPSLHLVLIPAR